LTGYFSRLAERTGLGLASPPARAARTANGGLAPSPEFARESAPLHAEEITFVAQTQDDAPEAPTQSAAEAFRDATREGDFARSQRDAERISGSTTEAATRSSTASAANEHEPETPRRRRLADSADQLQSFPEEAETRSASAPHHRTSREPESYEPSDGISESPRRTDAAESLPAVADQARARESQRREETLESPDDFNSLLEREGIGGMSRAEVYQNYLREVRKWVAEDVAATLDEGTLNERSSVAALEASAEDALAYIREREAGTQDFNLSIGTISIVVEETPPPQTVMQPTPPARAERAQPARTSRSSGRNYLRFK